MESAYSFYNQDPNDARFFASCNMAMPAVSFLDIGGFDAAFPHRIGGSRPVRSLAPSWLSHALRVGGGRSPCASPELGELLEAALQIRAWPRGASIEHDHDAEVVSLGSCGPTLAFFPLFGPRFPLGAAS